MHNLGASLRGLRGIPDGFPWPAPGAGHVIGKCPSEGLLLWRLKRVTCAGPFGYEAAESRGT
jgi:hypothetical protein